MKQFTKRQQSKMYLNQFLFTLWEQKDSAFQSLTIKKHIWSTQYEIFTSAWTEAGTRNPMKRVKAAGWNVCITTFVWQSHGLKNIQQPDQSVQTNRNSWRVKGKLISCKDHTSIFWLLASSNQIPEWQSACIARCVPANCLIHQICTRCEQTRAV